MLNWNNTIALYGTLFYSGYRFGHGWVNVLSDSVIQHLIIHRPAEEVDDTYWESVMPHIERICIRVLGSELAYLIYTSQEGFALHIHMLRFCIYTTSKSITYSMPNVDG